MEREAGRRRRKQITSREGNDTDKYPSLLSEEKHNLSSSAFFLGVLLVHLSPGLLWLLTAVPGGIYSHTQQKVYMAQRTHRRSTLTTKAHNLPVRIYVKQI
jgi:hypothetical protein